MLFFEIDTIVKHKLGANIYRVAEIIPNFSTSEQTYDIRLIRFDGHELTIHRPEIANYESYEKVEMHLQDFNSLSENSLSYGQHVFYDTYEGEVFTLPSEKWYNPEELDGLFQLSNYGRIKRLNFLKYTGFEAIIKDSYISLLTTPSSPFTFRRQRDLSNEIFNSFKITERQIRFRHRHELLHEILYGYKLPRWFPPADFKEEFKDIVGFDGLYQISNLGRIKSLNLERKGYKDNILVSMPNKIRKTYEELVGIAFLPNPNNHKYIQHKNHFDRSNYYVGNLEWCSQSTEAPRKSKFPFLTYNSNLELWKSNFYWIDKNLKGELFFIMEDEAGIAFSTLFEKNVFLMSDRHRLIDLKYYVERHCIPKTEKHAEAIDKLKADYYTWLLFNASYSESQ